MHQKYTAKDAWLEHSLWCFFFAKTVNDSLFPQKGSVIDTWQALNTEAVAQRYFIKKVFLQNFGKSTGKNLY